jgi:subtilisin family serine protease
MRTLQFFLLALLFLFFALQTSAQPGTIFQEDFSEDILPDGWSTTDVNDNDALWVVSPQGTAPDGDFWDNRMAIESPTISNGAVMLDSDGLFNDTDPPVAFPHHAILESPLIDCSAAANVWLQFYQYYRSGATTASVGVSNDGGLTWTDIAVNTEIGFGTETQRDSRVILNITELAAGFSEVRIRFVFEGAYYFWIIDDVALIEPEPNNPENPIYTETFPPALGDSLTAWNITYNVDSLGGAYPTNELVVQWVEGIEEGAKQNIRDDLGIIDSVVCTCSDLELFIFPTSISQVDNLVQNGDFSGGNVDFTSELVEDCSCISDSYCIGTKFSDKCSTFAATEFEEFLDPGNGQFMIVDGPAFVGAEVWCQNIPLVAGEDYVFSFRARSGANGNFPALQLNVGTENEGMVTVSAAGAWENIVFPFQHTQASGTYQVCLEQTNAGSFGYDYGLDDLFLANLSADELIFQDSIEEKKDKGDGMPAEIEEIEFNYYNFDIEELKDTLPVVNEPFEVNENTGVGNEEDDLLIAILDTGIDYNYFDNTPSPVLGNFDISPYMWRDPDFTTCYDGDHEGWNFVHFDDPNKQDRPFDDHGHGTHVAGILIQQWEIFRSASNNALDGCCNLKILPVKTHDFHGLGKLFDVSCGIVYATEMGADLINASWGFTAVMNPDSGALHYAIDRANEDGRRVVVVTSAGNAGVDIDSPAGAPATPNYPSNYNLSNIITVAALDSLDGSDNIWEFSNFSPTEVHYAAPGYRIPSTVPPGTVIGDAMSAWDEKSGTSMAAPVVTAYAGLLYCMENVDDDLEMKAKLAEYAVDMNSDWSTLSITGKKMEPGTFLSQIDFANCITGSSPVLSNEANINIYPNPAGDWVQLSIIDNQVPIDQVVLSNLLGQSIWQQQFEDRPSNIDLEMDISALPKGTYQVSIFTDRGAQGFLIVKQ